LEDFTKYTPVSCCQKAGQRQSRSFEDVAKLKLVGGWDQNGSFREIGWRVWIGFDWLRIGTDGELLCVQ
jgi:hypothetical protein